MCIAENDLSTKYIVLTRILGPIMQCNEAGIKGETNQMCDR